MDGFTVAEPRLIKTHLPAPTEDDTPKRKQSRDCEDHIRYVKGHWQLRIWTAGTEYRRGTFVNAGLYKSESAAASVKEELLELLENVARPLTPLAVWTAGIKPLRDRGVIPTRVLPLWVRPDGKGRFFAAIKVMGEKLVTSPVAQPERAYKTLERKIEVLMREKGVRFGKARKRVPHLAQGYRRWRERAGKE